jgi:hypothetical protein
MFETLGPPPLQPIVKMALVLWFVALPLWALFAMLSGMAFDAGPRFSAYCYVWSMFTYPVLLGIAFFYRRRRPGLIWLPGLTLCLVIMSVFIEHWGF